MARPATATRDRILHAAFERFSRYGYRRTSMEDIAEAAGVSRAALYLQFRNKEAIFRSLAEALQEQALTGAAAALSGDAPLAERLQAAAEAKSVRFVEIAYGSPHGSELMDASNRICGDLAVQAERRFQKLLTGVFRHAAQSGEIDLAAVGLAAAEAAQLFTRTAAGLKVPGVTVDTYRKGLAAWVRVFVAGLGGGLRSAANGRPHKITTKTPRSPSPSL